MENTRRKFSFTVSSEVISICSPLASLLGAGFFLYQRSFLNEKDLCVDSNAFLCSNLEVLEHIVSMPQKSREKAKYDYFNGRRKYILVDTTQPKFANILRQKFKAL